MNRHFFSFSSIFLMLMGCASFKSIDSEIEGSTVNLSRRDLTEIPSEVFENKSIKVLKLYGNKLESITEEIGQLENLEKLFIGRNNLTSLPDAIGQLKNLKILSAQYNLIDSLPSSLGEMTNLEQIILNQNKLTFLPSTIGELKNLDVLKLNFNSLKNLPEEIGNCENLQFIHLNQNNLRRLPNSLSELRKLRELYISNAGVMLDLPEELCGLRYLEVLQIDQTTLVPNCLLIQRTNRLRIIQ